MAGQGESLFNQLGCGNCHPSTVQRTGGRAPNLVGIFGTTVDLKDGPRIKADESYIRESILNPEGRIVAGYDNIMPTFKGLITEDGLLKLVEYIKSLGPADGAPTPAPPGAVDLNPKPGTARAGSPAAQAGKK